MDVMSLRLGWPDARGLRYQMRPSDPPIAQRESSTHLLDLFYCRDEQLQLFSIEGVLETPEGMVGECGLGGKNVFRKRDQAVAT